MRDTCQNTKEFSPHSKFPFKKSVLSLKNKCSYLNHEFGFITLGRLKQSKTHLLTPQLEHHNWQVLLKRDLRLKL